MDVQKTDQRRNDQQPFTVGYNAKKRQGYSFDYWYRMNWYYYRCLEKYYQFIIPKGSSVLHVGCKNGALLNAVEPLYGVGIDHDEGLLAAAQKRYAQLNFYAGSFTEYETKGSFEYIILSSCLMEIDDIQQFLQELHQVCRPETRIIVDSYSYLWEPLLWFAEKIGRRRPTQFEQWISLYDIEHFLHLAGFEVIKKEQQLLFPLYIPLFSWFINTVVAQLPLINKLCLSQWIIARPVPALRPENTVSVSVIITCKNEKGNIVDAVERCPAMGRTTELIFVEGGSSDGTWQEIERVKLLYPEKTIRYYKQQGKGKGDAVRCGFEHASGDILMILDGDLTVPPEELPLFLKALLTGKGEFINGSRLVYGMESEAMRFLNLLANYFFGVLFSWLLGQRIKDTLCGTKVLLKKEYEKIAAQRAYFGEFDPFGDFDLLFGAAKRSLKIIDMPVHYKNRTYGSTQIRRFYHGWILLGMSMIALKKFKIRI